MERGEEHISAVHFDAGTEYYWNYTHAVKVNSSNIMNEQFEHFSLYVHNFIYRNSFFAHISLLQSSSLLPYYFYLLSYECTLKWETLPLFHMIIIDNYLYVRYYIGPPFLSSPYY